jgi:hypothetical protein
LQKLLEILGLVFTGNHKYLIILKRLQKMKKYNEEYFSVIEIKTGKKLLDCGEESDALTMVSFDPQNRTYTRNKFLMGPVIDIEIPKALPTSEIVGCAGSSSKSEYPKDVNSPLPQIKLPEDQRIPVNAK